MQLTKQNFLQVINSTFMALFCILYAYKSPMKLF